MTVPDLPSGLQERGRRLWSESVKVKPDLAPGEVVLLEEACRLADRLDVLAALLDGDGEAWGRVRDARGDDAPSTLIINSALAEARMGAGELRQLVKALAAPAVEAEAPPVPSGVTSILAKSQKRAGGKR